jgi:hypothetical protein
VHQSTVNDRVLFYFRLFAFILLTAIYVWTIAVIQQSLMENIMYLTMIGYLLSWLYFGLTLQDYCLNFGGKPLSRKYSLRDSGCTSTSRCCMSWRCARSCR